MVNIEHEDEAKKTCTQTELSVYIHMDNVNGILKEVKNGLNFSTEILAN